MKFTIICIIGMCLVGVALSAQNVDENNTLTATVQIVPRNGGFGISDVVINKLKVILQLYINTVNKSGQAIISEASEIVDAINADLDTLYKQAQKTFVPIIKKTLDQVEVLMDKHDDNVDCLAELNEQLLMLIDAIPYALYKCVENAGDESKHFIEIVEKQVNNIIAYTDSINDTIQLCLETTDSITGYTVCVTKQAKEIFTNSLKLVTDTKDSLKDTAGTSFNVVLNAGTCFTTTTIDIQKTLANSVLEMTKCVVS